MSSLIELQMPPVYRVVPVTVHYNASANKDPSVEGFREVQGQLILFGVWVGIVCEFGSGHVLHPMIPQRGYEAGAGVWLHADEGPDELLRIVINDREDDGIDFIITTNNRTPICWGSFTQPETEDVAGVVEEDGQAMD